jgi:hypothetical protein
MCSAMLSARLDFPMLGTSGDDDEVAVLQSRRHLVDVDEAGGLAGDGRGVAV